jgi:hypothetical protein
MDRQCAPGGRCTRRFSRSAAIAWQIPPRWCSGGADRRTIAGTASPGSRVIDDALLPPSLAQADRRADATDFRGTGEGDQGHAPVTTKRGKPVPKSMNSWNTAGRSYPP